MATYWSLDQAVLRGWSLRWKTQAGENQFKFFFTSSHRQVSPGVLRYSTWPMNFVVSWVSNLTPALYQSSTTQLTVNNISQNNDETRILGAGEVLGQSTGHSLDDPPRLMRGRNPTQGREVHLECPSTDREDDTPPGQCKHHNEGCASPTQSTNNKGQGSDPQIPSYCSLPATSMPPDTNANSRTTRPKITDPKNFCKKHQNIY